jgi:ATP-dependent DNA helicase RecG
VLSALDVIGGGRNHLMRAGELLFCQRASAAPSPLIVYQYRQTPGGDPRDVQRIEAPLVNAVQRVLELVNARRS